MKICDEKDGLKDGMIFNPQACHYDPAVLQCKGAKTETCLTADQVGALQKAFAGPKDSRGNEVYAPFPWETRLSAGRRRPVRELLAECRAQHFGRRPAAVRRGYRHSGRPRPAPTKIETLTDTTWTNLSTFFGHGGKIAFLSRHRDPVFSPFDTLAYYKRMADANGGLDQVMNSSRFYFVPGMNHCGGGPAALDKFDHARRGSRLGREGQSAGFRGRHGQAVSGPHAVRSAPIPKHAQYKGQGNPEDAGSFECVK